MLKSLVLKPDDQHFRLAWFLPKIVPVWKGIVENTPTKCLSASRKLMYNILHQAVRGFVLLVLLLRCQPNIGHKCLVQAPIALLMSTFQLRCLEGSG